MSTAQLHATGGQQYLWSPGKGLSDSTIANPMVYTNQTTEYLVTAFNAEGCRDTVKITVQVSVAGGSGFFVPNAFTAGLD